MDSTNKVPSQHSLYVITLSEMMMIMQIPLRNATIKFNLLQKPNKGALLGLDKCRVSSSGMHFAINNRFLRERGMESTLKMEYQVFLCIFQTNLAIATLVLKEMGKFLWEGREKVLPCWLSQFSFASFFVWKMQKKIWYYEKWVGRHASFPPRRSVK
jgi:hypothetical protein